MWRLVVDCPFPVAGSIVWASEQREANGPAHFLIVTHENLKTVSFAFLAANQGRGKIQFSEEEKTLFIIFTDHYHL